MPQISVRSTLAAMGVAAASLAFAATAQTQPTDAQVEAALQNLATSSASQLPMQIDAETRLDAVTAGPGKRLDYRITLTIADLDELDKAVFEKFTREASKTQACKGMAMVAPYGVVVGYRFDAPNGDEYMAFEVDLSDC